MVLVENLTLPALLRSLLPVFMGYGRATNVDHRTYKKTEAFLNAKRTVTAQAKVLLFSIE